VSQDHQEAQELLAGYALRALSGPDAAQADRLLVEHVPGCPACRAALEDFGALTGELALMVDPIEPPDLLLARLHRDMAADGGGHSGRWAGGWVAASVAGVVLLLGLGGLLASRGGGGTSATLAAADLSQIAAAAERPDAETHDLGQVAEVSVPDRSGFFLWGEQVAPPPPGMIYHLWLLADGTAHDVGAFAPDAAGVVAIHVEVEGSYDQVLVTVEDAVVDPSMPGTPAWSLSPSPAEPAG